MPVAGGEVRIIGTSIQPRRRNIIERPSNTAEHFVFENYRGIAPSPSTYQGVWNWDSGFHLIAMSYWDKEVAHDQMRILFEHQKANGQIADVVYTSGKTVFKFTKPPVLAWSIMVGDKISPDTDFLDYCYPFLLKNLEWWETARFDGMLFGYKVHKMESGWDSTVRFDFPHGIDSCYAIDGNCYMVTFYQAMEYIAERLGKGEVLGSLREKKNTLVNGINATLYNQKRGYCCDYNKRLSLFTNRISPASFMPLFVGIASEERAISMRTLAEDPRHFYKGLPTISYSHAR